MNPDAQQGRRGAVSTDACTHLHYTTWGDGEPLLLLHGFPTSGLLWQETARLLSGRFACVCPDLPGWGESSRMATRGPALLEASIPIFEALEHACGRPIQYIAATDAGAVLAAYYAAVRPERVKRLVLMSAPVWPDFNVPWPMRILRTSALGTAASFLLKPLIFWRMGLGGADLVRYTEEHRQSFSRPFRGLWGGPKLADRVRWGDPQEVLTPLSRLLPRIKARTLVVHCTGDNAVPEEMARRTADAIPDARVLSLEGPHFIPLTHPEQVARHLSEFFTEP